MIENSTQGLTVLDADLDAEVVDADPAALAAWAPDARGRARRVAAELAVINDARGREWTEVRIDGVAVGRLPADAAQRHARHITAVLDRGGRPAANALVLAGPRVELRLPDPAAPVRAPLPPAGPPAERPDALGLHDRLPPERPRSRTPLLVGAGVLALLLAVGVVVGTRPAREPATTGVAVAPITTPAPVPTTTPVTTTPAPTTTEAARERAAATSIRTRRPAATRAPASADAAPASRTPVVTTTTSTAPTTEVVTPTTTAPAARPGEASRGPERDDCTPPLVGPPDPDCEETPAPRRGDAAPPSRLR